MSAQHTPGPWSIGHLRTRQYAMASGNWHEFPVHVGEGQRRGNAIAIVYMGGPGVISSAHAEVAANARLIAAVPDLLAAAQAEEEWRGREAAGALDPEWDYETMVGAKRRAAIAKATGSAATIGG